MAKMAVIVKMAIEAKMINMTIKAKLAIMAKMAEVN